MAANDAIAIKVKDLRKSFNLAENKSSSIKQLFVSVGKRQEKNRQEVLKGLSFEIEKGDFFGIVGRNGSGKSTLLKILAGVYAPDAGMVHLAGQLTPFIELGVGFNHELSGRDNVFLNTSLLGYTHKQTEAIYDDIVKFAELEEHMDKKLKNYSSGMQVRLAFSIAIKAKNDILIFDEVLAVGDVNFQRKCFRHFSELKRNKQTVVFVSHSMEQVIDYCNKVLVLHDGKILFNGEPDEAVRIYEDLNEEKTVTGPDGPDAYISGDGPATIKLAKLDKTTYALHDQLALTIKYAATKEVDRLFYGISLYRSDRGQSIYAVSGELDPRATNLELTIKSLALTPGKYYFSYGLTHEADNWRTHYVLHEKQLAFTVKRSKSSDAQKLAPLYMESEVRS